MARPRGDIERRLLAAARACFLSEGYSGTSLREVARAAGTSVGMIHYYHHDKRALFLAVVEATYARTLADLEKALAPDAPYGTRVRRLYLKLATLSDDERETVRLVAREAITHPSLLKSLLERFLRGHIPLLLRLVTDGQIEGRVRTDLSPLVVVASLMGIGVAPTVIRRVATREISPALAKSKLPAPLRALAKAAIESLPAEEALAGILEELALAALAPKKSG
jgi:AcrR family transcriptional regulator